MIGRLKDKTIIVTGGSMGIGLAIAKECAKEGARLILISRHKEDLKKALVEINLNASESHNIHQLDVSQESKVKLFANQLRKQKICVDGLVNAAAIIGPINKTEDLDPSFFEETIKINLFGTLNMCRYLIPYLRKAARGKIVNLSGGGATNPFPNYSAYAVSKIGVVRLTENIALEYKDKNIDINAISPGFVITRMHQETLKAGDRAGTEYLKRTMEEIKKDGMSADHAAKLTVFLLSKDSDGITGKLLSAPWDPWDKEDFREKLKQDNDFCTLRRIDNQFFFKKTKK